VCFSGEAGGQVEGVEVAAVGCGGCGEAEEDLPEAGVDDRLAGAIDDLTDVREGLGVEGIDDAVAQVANQDVAAEDAEGRGSNSYSPRRVDVAAGGDGVGDVVAERSA
jgi:hypothetical protein